MPSAKLICLAHFLAWLDTRGVQITDCTAEDLAAYERALDRFRPGVRGAYGRVARSFVAFAAASD